LDVAEWRRKAGREPFDHDLPGGAASMTRLTRILVAGAMVVAMSLATTAAVAQTHTHHEDPAAQQEAAQRWSDYHQSTRVAPAELEARARAEATRRALAERWTYYHHATQVPPAELQARTQARAGAGDSAAAPTRTTVPPLPDGPIGQPGWLAISLGLLVAVIVGLAVLAARFSGGGPRVRPAT
jgi:hypothetical protein